MERGHAASSIDLGLNAERRRPAEGRRLQARSEARETSRTRRYLRFGWLSVLAVGGCAALAVEAIRPVAYHAPTLRATLETVISSCALISVLLLRDQFNRNRRLRDLLLMGALLTFVLLDLASNALPAAVDVTSGSQFQAAFMCGSLLTAAAFVAAARAPASRLVRRGGRPIAATILLSLGAVGLSELCGRLLHSSLIVSDDRVIHGFDAAMQRPLALMLALSTAGLFAYAAVALIRGEERDQGILGLLAGAAILLAVSRLYYVALPGGPPTWLSSREVLRLFAAGLIVSAAVREELQDRRMLAEIAALAERRRVARDLHDGIAQDLAFIAAHGAQIANEAGSEHPVAIAARRALAVSRGTISELSSTPPSSADALQAVAHELRKRFQVAIDVDVQPGAEVRADAQDDAVRIVREAIANSVRHGGASEIRVSLTRHGSGSVLSIRDDGRGLGARPEGFGVGSMRDRAAVLGGELTLRNRPEGGTEIEVALP